MLWNFTPNSTVLKLRITFPLLLPTLRAREIIDLVIQMSDDWDFRSKARGFGFWGDGVMR